MRLEDLIEQNYHKLSENELYIWEYIRQHPAECRSISIDQLAAACNISANQVNVKATTEEGLGFTGSLEGISAHAVCLLE